MAAAVGGGGGGGGGAGGRTFFLDGFAARQWDDPAYDGTVLRFDRGRFVERVHELHADGGGAPLVPGYAVLARWFPAQVVEAPEAKFLDIILYSREQLEIERASSQPPESAETATPLPAPWGIICIKAQDVDHELPMSPITMMRNALGTVEGGSGVALDRKKYEDSVKFWDSHANITGGLRELLLGLPALSRESESLPGAELKRMAWTRQWTSSMSPARSSTSSPAMRKRKRPAAMESFLSTACEW
eukprot:SM000273S10237  [mRNA]  locus=s273:84211:87263:+ [translate_table: standard]